MRSWGGKEAGVTQACIYKTKRGMGLLAGVWDVGSGFGGSCGLGAWERA